MNPMDHNQASRIWPLCVIDASGRVLWHDINCKSVLTDLGIWSQSTTAPQLVRDWVRQLWASLDCTGDQDWTTVKAPDGRGFGIAWWSAEKPDILGLSFWPDETSQQAVDPLWGQIFDLLHSKTRHRHDAMRQRPAA